MSYEAMFSFFVAIFIFAITPGPGTFAILARGLSSGAKACVFLALGMTISDAMYLIFACFGLATLATHYSDVFVIIRFIGAFYLFYLGYKMWTTPVNLEINTEQKVFHSPIKSFIQGFLISASNPKVILFYIAFLPTFIDLTKLTTGDIVIATLLSIIALMLGLMLVGSLAAKISHYFHSKQATKRLNRTAGSIMMLAGGFLITSK